MKEKEQHHFRDFSVKLVTYSVPLWARLINYGKVIERTEVVRVRLGVKAWWAAKLRHGIPDQHRRSKKDYFLITRAGDSVSISFDFKVLRSFWKPKIANWDLPQESMESFKANIIHVAPYSVNLGIRQEMKFADDGIIITGGGPCHCGNGRYLGSTNYFLAELN